MTSCSGCEDGCEWCDKIPRVGLFSEGAMPDYTPWVEAQRRMQRLCEKEVLVREASQEWKDHMVGVVVRALERQWHTLAHQKDSSPLPSAHPCLY